MSVLESGQVLSHYRVEGLIGAGGMGEVYRAIDAKLNRPVAIKLLPRGTASNRNARQRLLREARTASALNHPNIVTIHAVERARGLDFIVMEYVEGVTLATRLQEGPLSCEQMLDVGVPVALALADAHGKGLIHRDVKPSNIALTTRGQPKLMDFGLAKEIREAAPDERTATDLSGAGTVAGTVRYMSPEQTRGEALDGRSDIFSLGITLYECATGRLPFEGRSTLEIAHAIATADPVPPSTLRPGLPPALNGILARALSKDRAKRHRTATELAEELNALRTPGGDIAIVRPPEVEGKPSIHNLPADLTSFIGRENERAEVRSFLARARLVTLTGSGGCGKTRLAIQVARDLLPDYPDGVWLADLASLQDETLVTQTVALILDVREEPGKPLLQTLAQAIGSKRLLLFLDNCEHLAASCAKLAEDLLRLCPGLTILATSRETLRVSGEWVWRIPSLSIPDVRGALPGSKMEAERFESVRLFAERAAASRPGYTLGDEDAPAVARICYHLDGIPLAIELAAARVNLFPAEEILARLESRFHLLTGGSRTALPRQQTLRAAMDWSYELLSKPEQILLQRLGVFAGGFTVDGTEAVCSGDGLGGAPILELLSNLVDKSLVVPEERDRDRARFRLLETIREYARERLEGARETEAVEARHGLYFAGVASRAEPELQGPRQADWFNRLEREHDNMRLALEHFVRDGNAERARELAGSLFRFWWVRGNWEEGRRRLDDVLAMTTDGSRTTSRSRALYAAAVFAGGQGDYASSRTALNESLAIDRELGNTKGIALTLFELGNIANDEEDLPRARSLYEESLAVSRQLGDKGAISSAVHNLGVVCQAEGDYPAARSLYEQALDLHRELGNRSWEAASLNGLGDIALSQGDLGAAFGYQEKGLAIQREIGDRRGIAYSLRELGQIAERRGELARARELLLESLTILREIGGRQWIADTLESLASLAVAREEPELALRLAGGAASLRKEIGTPLSQPDMERLEERLDLARKMLGPGASEEAFTEGSRMTMEKSMDLAAAGHWH